MEGTTPEEKCVTCTTEEKAACEGKCAETGAECVVKDDEEEDETVDDEE